MLNHLSTKNPEPVEDLQTNNMFAHLCIPGHLFHNEIKVLDSLSVYTVQSTTGSQTDSSSVPFSLCYHRNLYKPYQNENVGHEREVLRKLFGISGIGLYKRLVTLLFF